jgi:DNA-binding MarR family transcriptional regulator
MQPTVNSEPAPDPIDRIVHEPARLSLLATLRGVEEADFVFLRGQTGLTKGNLSAHLAKLEAAGYVSVTKSFNNRTPRTVYRLTPSGEGAITRYVAGMTDLLESLER